MHNTKVFLFVNVHFIVYWIWYTVIMYMFRVSISLFSFYYDNHIYMMIRGVFTTLNTNAGLSRAMLVVSRTNWCWWLSPPFQIPACRTWSEYTLPAAGLQCWCSGLLPDPRWVHEHFPTPTVCQLVEFSFFLTIILACSAITIYTSCNRWLVSPVNVILQ